MKLGEFIMFGVPVLTFCGILAVIAIQEGDTKCRSQTPTKDS
jgi:hypothetical protein